MPRIRFAYICFLLIVCVMFCSVEGAFVGDINGDGGVDFIDLQMLGVRWLDGSCQVPDCDADIAGGSGVDMSDFATLAEDWNRFESPLVISEFLASNDNASVDEEGDSSDWIEIFNPSVDIIAPLGRCYLTDDEADKMKWQFPEGVTVDPGKFLLVYASGKDYRDPAGELHTTFRLNRDGEYLALTAPDGQTVISEFGPQFPKQLVDVSYGIVQGTITETLVLENAPKRVLVPEGEVDEGWKGGDESFDDGNWNDGVPVVSGKAGGVGYERSSGYQDYISYDVQSKMYNITGTCYIRIPFAIDPDQVSIYSILTLKVRHDDAFVAYLNGEEIARSARIPSPLLWNSNASTNRPSDSVFLEEFDVTEYVGLLGENNILAIHGLNGGSSTSSDFLISTELVAGGAEITQYDEAAYFKDPTPGRVNSSGFMAILTEPEFSVTGHLFMDPFVLTLSTESDQISIHYTLDGSAPERTSSVYTSPLNISTTTQVRARIYDEDNQPGPVVSHTYLKLESDASGFSSNLSVIVIDTDGQSIGTDPYRRVSAVFLEPDADGRTRLTGKIDYAGIGGIKRRGSSTAGTSKPSFAFEVWDDDNEDLDVSLFGFDAESDWVLYSPYIYDRALINNALAYDLSNQVGRYAVRTKFVEVFLNTNGNSVSSSDYFGLYIFMEKIKQDPKRVDVESLSVSTTGEPDISGGYITKIDRLDPGDSGLSTSRGMRVGYVYPKEDLIPSWQANWIRNFFNEFEAALYGSDYRDPQVGYAAYIDVDSWVDHNLVNMITMNVDALRLSTYMHKGRGKKLEMGPVWDFDRAMNSTDGRDDNPSSWNGTGDGTDYFSWGWWDRIFDDPDFMLRYQDRWYMFRKEQFSTANINMTIDSMADEIREAQQRHFDRWSSTPPRYGGFQGEIDHLKEWFDTRVNWVDAQFSKPPVFSKQGGAVEAGYELTISPAGGTSGTVYYTTDGSDPRQAVTGIAVGAQYTAAIEIQHSVRVKARVKNGSSWSAVSDEIFTVGPVADNLRITELMYHPSIIDDPNDQNAEFIELKNIGAESINLNLVKFTKGVEFAFGNMSLGAGEYTVIGRSITDFERYYPDFDGVIAGWFTGALDNDGDRIVLVDAVDKVIHDFKYKDSWYEITDGGGFSLTIKDPTLTELNHVDEGLVGHWKLDENSGFDVIDSSGNNLLGTLVGNPIWRTSSGKMNGAIELNGVDDFIEIIDYKGLVGSSRRTCAAWIKTTDGEGQIISWGLFGTVGARWNVVLSGGRLRVEAGGGATVGTSIINDGNWHHVSAVSDGIDIGDVMLYVDGKLEDITIAGSVVMNTVSSTNVCIGAYPSSPIYFAGLIDNVCIYDRMLSLEEVAALSESYNYWDSKQYWRPSARIGGSPGLDDTGDVVAESGSVIVNEVLAHSDTTPYDWIELHNTTDEDINIGGWFISDSDNDFTKFEIEEGTLLEANGYVVLTQNQFGTIGAAGCNTPFGLSENGEKLFLHSGQGGVFTGYAEERSFGASDPDVSIGLYTIPSTGEVEFVAMSEVTEGFANAYPKVGPIVISEIMYHPANDGDAEYIELLNISAKAVTLYDSDRNMPWRIDGIDNFNILIDQIQVVTMAAGERILLVKDLSEFNAEFDPKPGTVIIEWLNGSLRNDGESIELVKPGDYDADLELQYILVDAADYSDGEHPEGNRPDLWPREPDGGTDTNNDDVPDKSMALKRTPESNYGNDPTNWQSAEPSPGS